MASYQFHGFCATLKNENDFCKEKKFLDNVFCPPDCRQSTHQEVSRNDLFADPLDTIRQNAHEEFVRNGIEVELDDLDVYQFRVREGQSALPPSSSDNTESGKLTGSSAVEDYLEMRRQKRKKKTVAKWCVFCKNNGEMSEWYQSHTLKDNLGRTICPILRRYTCPRCGKSGDSAHTIRYCPRNHGEEIEPAISQLLKTDRLSSGRLRYSKC